MYYNVHPKMYLLFWINSRRIYKNGMVPIYVRITVDGLRVELSLARTVPEEYWDKSAQIVSNKYEEAGVLNSYLTMVKGQLMSIYNQSIACQEKITAALIRDKYLGKDAKNQKKTITEAFEYHNIKMEELVKIDKITKKTLMRYQSTLSKIKYFMQTYKGIKDIALEDVKLSFITEFEHYLVTKERLQNNTIHKEVKIVKKVFNMAVALDWIPSHPLNAFKTSYRHPVRQVLTQEELYVLINKDFSIERLAEVRDVFIFCCYTGFAYGDIYHFEQGDEELGIDGNLWLSTQRRKTGVQERVPLLPIAVKIIEKYKNHEYCKRYNKLLPINSNQRYNAYLQEIGIICNIKKKLTTHIARHTFATTITLANGVPIETVSAMLGHTSIKTTQIYAKVLEKKVSEDMNQLRSKLFGTNMPWDSGKESKIS
jgi:site-specific recombinase XerD